MRGVHGDEASCSPAASAQYLSHSPPNARSTGSAPLTAAALPVPSDASSQTPAPSRQAEASVCTSARDLSSGSLVDKCCRDTCSQHAAALCMRSARTGVSRKNSADVLQGPEALSCRQHWFLASASCSHVSLLHGASACSSHDSSGHPYCTFA